MRSLAAALVLTLPVAAAADLKPRLAVMEVKAGQGLDEKEARTLTSLLVADGARAGLDVVPQSSVQAALSLQKDHLMPACGGDGCLALFGEVLGADLVLSGEAAIDGSRVHVSVALFDPKRGQVVGRSAGFSDPGVDALPIAVLAHFRAALKEARPDMAAAALPIEPPSVASASARRNAAWWTLGGAGALLAAGTAFGLSARMQANVLQEEWRNPDYAAAYDRQRRTARAADVLFAAGAVAGGVGTWLYLTSAPPVIVLPVAGGAPGVSIAASF